MDLLALAGMGITVGGTEAVHRQRLLDREAEGPERLEEFYIDVFCDAKSRKREEVHGASVVLEDGRVRLWPKDPKRQMPAKGRDGRKAPHAFMGFYLPFPMDELPHRPIPYTPVLGLVSTIPSTTPTPSAKSTSKPKLHWLYADPNTRELRYGPRAEAKKHVIGHWDWTDDEQGLTLEGEECFVAVEEENGGYGWAVYWDREDDCLKGIGVGEKKRVLRCSLERRLVEEREIGGLGED